MSLLTAERRRTRPRTPTTNSLRSFLASSASSGPVGLEDDLGQALAVADVDEDEVAHVAGLVDPAAEDDLAAFVGGPQVAAVMGPLEGCAAVSGMRSWISPNDQFSRRKLEELLAGAVDLAAGGHVLEAEAALLHLVLADDEDPGRAELVGPAELGLDAAVLEFDQAFDAARRKNRASSRRPSLASSPRWTT